MKQASSPLNILPLPMFILDEKDTITDANSAAEALFGHSLVSLRRQTLSMLLPFSSPVLSLIGDVRRRSASVTEHRIDLDIGRDGSERVVDIFAAPLPDDPACIIMLLQERTLADKMNRQLTHRGAARSLTALGAMLAHEIKNPLSGIRGAAQLLEQQANEEDRVLTTLICNETDRIVTLVERMEMFGDEAHFERRAVNVHGVLDHVKRLAVSGFARHIRFTEQYDPSLPPVYGDRDRLVQVFLNLVKNAAEAIGPDARDGEIVLSSAYRPGVRLQSPGTGGWVGLPLEFCVRDNGPGVPSDLLPCLFDPFVTTKTQGSGLGLALVAKVVDGHSGVVECESMPGKTVFRLLLPMVSPHDGRAVL